MQERPIIVVNETPRLLVVTNMGPKPANPFQGQFVTAQVDTLREQGHVVDYHYMRWHSDSLLNRLLKYPVFFSAFFFKYVLSRKKYDVVHVHFYYPTIWLALLYKAIRNHRVNIVVTCHGSDIYLYQPPRKLYRWAATKVQAWIFTSSSLATQFFFKPRHAQVLSAGIHAHYAAARFASYAEKDIDVLYVGTLDKNKGMDRLIAMLPAVTQYKIVVAGAGPWLAPLQAAAQQYPNLTLLGGQPPSALLQLYQRARCFISLSRKESFGLVMAEAMACYTPVVATQTDGALAQIKHGVTGFMTSQQCEPLPVNERSHSTAQAEPNLSLSEATIVSGLVDAITQLHQLAPSQYADMQHACRKQAETVLLPEVIVKLRQLYQELYNDNQSS